jgi:hypothetical protein
VPDGLDAEFKDTSFTRYYAVPRLPSGRLEFHAVGYHDSEVASTLKLAVVGSIASDEFDWSCRRVPKCTKMFFCRFAASERSELGYTDIRCIHYRSSQYSFMSLS